MSVKKPWDSAWKTNCRTKIKGCVGYAPSESKESRATNRSIFLDNKNERTLIYQRVNEPNEGAFSLLVPKGWQIAGGIFRVNPMSQGGATQSIAANLDFTVKKDRSGSMMIRRLPDILYFDASRSPAGQMGLFPPGSNYNGMTVYPLMSALQ